LFLFGGLFVLVSLSKPIGQWMPVRLYHAAAEVGARVVLLGNEPIRHGDEAYVQLVLERPIAAAAGDRYILRDPSARRTIGGGRLLDLRPPARRRRTPERRSVLEALALAEPERTIGALLDRPPFHFNLLTFARDRALAASEVAATVERVGGIRISSRSATTAVSPAWWLHCRSSVVAAVAAFHAANPDLRGLGRERLRSLVDPPLREAVFAVIIQELVRAGELVIDGSLLRVPTHELRLSDWDEEVWRQVRRLLEGPGRFCPPRSNEIAGALGVSETKIRQLMHTLERTGSLVQVADQHFFLREALAELIEIAADISAANMDGQLTVAQFRDHVGIGRRIAIQILEFFDRHGVTRRRGDARRLNTQRLHLFSGAKSADRISNHEIWRGDRP
jgi:selenocysteine-specific elongation factor